MKIKLIILILLAGANCGISATHTDNVPLSVARHPPGAATILLDYLGSEYYDADWGQVSDLLGTLLGMGYMTIRINNFEYQYHCTHCEGIGYQGRDPLVVDPKNLAPIHAWCKRNSGKFAELGFYKGLDFSVVTEVVQIFNSYKIKFSLSNADRSEQIKIDLLDGRPKIKKAE